MHDALRFRDFRNLTIFYVNDKAPRNFAEGLIARKVVDGFVAIHVGFERFLFNVNMIQEITLEIGHEQETHIYPGMPF